MVRQQMQLKLNNEHHAVLADMFTAFMELARDTQRVRALVGEEASLAWLPADKEAADKTLSAMAMYASGISTRFMTDDYDEHRPVTEAPKVIRKHGRSMINSGALMEYAAQDIAFKAEFEDHYDQALAAMKKILAAQLEKSLRKVQNTNRDLS